MNAWLDRGSALLSRIPGLHERRHAIEPCVHVHAPAGGENHNRVLVRRNHFLNELVLPGRQAKSAVRALTFGPRVETDRKSTRLNSSHANISYAVFCLKKKK